MPALKLRIASPASKAVSGGRADFASQPAMPFGAGPGPRSDAGNAAIMTIPRSAD